MSLKKILIITYYWPPAGGPGVQRWLKFAKYLPDFGWEPIIYTPENPSYPLIDNSLLDEIPDGIQIIRTKIWEPYQWAEKLNKNNKKFKAGQFDVGENQSWKSKLSIWVRGNFFIPDARVFWVKPSVRYLKKYIQENNIDTVVTTGPPHSMHLIGLQLKNENHQLKWIADFRDPWTEISYYKHLKLTRTADLKHRKLEKEVFKKADFCIATSFTDADNFKTEGANAVCITNGFDISDVSEIKNLTNKKPDSKSNKFSISYIGVLEQLRNPEILWQVLSELIIENPDFKEDFILKFAGRIDDKILENLEKSPLKTAINNLGYLSHQKAIDEMETSDVLMITNFPEDTSKGIIPGKLFEYLASKKYILSFGPEDSDVSKIINETKSGKHFSYQQKTELKTEILKIYNLWKSNNPIIYSESVEKFSRKNITKKLSELLNQH